MTIRQWKDFKETIHHRKLSLLANGDIEKLRELEDQERQDDTNEAWKIAMEMATSIIVADAADVDVAVLPDALRKLRESLAEKLLLEQGYLPPTYKHLVKCESCGPVPSPREAKEEVQHCVFCAGVI